MTGGDVPSHAGPASPDVTAVAPAAEVGTADVLALVASGADGASFAATTASLGAVELWRLHPAVLTAEVRRRIVALQQQQHPSLLAVHALVDDPVRPALVVGRGALRWGDLSAHADRPGWLRQQLAGLFDGLAAAHRWNVVHGSIGPRSIALTEEGRLVLDLTGLDVRGLGRPPRAPEAASGGASAAADVWALATVARALPQGAGLDLAPLLEADPERRPSAREAAIALAQDQSTLVHPGDLPAPAGAMLDGVPRQLGPYRLLATIGTGGMGRVFRAADVDGTEVAVKVLLPSFAEDPEAVARFRREARVLAQLQTPHVARFVAANEHRGFQFLAMELAGGRPAADLVKERGRLDPDLVLAIGCDVARALAEVHALGLVHRDVKPANILVDGDGASPTVRLCDFGIARPALAAGDDQVTAAGRPGTPSFMAPEQVDGHAIDARSDVYALGCTLYALLAGHPPFQGIPQYVMVAHVSEPPPPLLEVEPSVPPGLAAIVMGCLAKHPAERPADGAALVEALEALRRGVAASAESLPQAIGLAGEPRVYDFQWRLRATCEELWPHVSNTDRINRAAGLDDVEWTHVPGEGQVQTEGKFRAAGIELRWKENPFEWVAPHRLGVVREYLGGPFLWLRSLVELIRRPDGETALRHRIEILPRGLFGRAAAGVEIGFRLRRSLERVYAHVDAACIAARAPATAAAGAGDPFEDPETVEADVRHAVEERVGRIVGRGGDPLIADALARDVASLPAPNLARLRPRRWARDHGFAEHATLDVFLLAAAEGLLELRWDILCPSCRVPSSIEESLRALQSHGRCDVCDLDFEHDLARSVELVFRAHPAIRQADAGVYCIGGPAHSPHVVAQVRLPAGERIALDLALGEGRYEVRGRGLPRAWPFAVDARAALSTWDLPLSTGVAVSVARSLGAEGQRLLLTNDLGHEVLVRVERVTARQDVVTAAEAATHARFRELFPEQVLAPDRLVSVSEVALVFAQVADALDRYQANEGEVHRQLVAISEALQRAATLEGGAVVRLQGDGVMAVFTDRAAALRAALALAAPGSPVAISIHAGPARMTTIGGHLDYFGRTLHVAEHMGRVAQAGEILVGEPILATASLVPLLRARTQPLGFLDVGATLVARVRPVDAETTRVSP